MWTIQDHLSLATDQAVEMRIVLQELKCIEGNQCEDKWHVVKLTRQAVNLVHGLYKPDVFDADGHVLHEFSHRFVGVFLCVLLQLLLFFGQTGALVFLASWLVSVVLLVHLLTENSGCDLWLKSLQELSLGILLNVEDVVENALIDILEAGSVLCTLYLGCKVNLTDH